MDRARLVLGILALGAATEGCSVILGSDLDAPQCTVDADCEREPALRGRVCRASFCVAPAIVATTPPGGSCLRSEECNGDGGTGANVCRDGTCVALLNETCRFIAGDFLDPTAVFLGSVLPEHVRQADGSLVEYAYGRRLRLAQRLAAEQWREKRAPLVDGDVRSLVLVQCDSEGTPATTERAVSHLLDVVGAPGIVVAGDDELASAYPQIEERQVAVVCSDCVGPAPAGAATRGLVRRILPPLVQQAPLAAKLVEELEPRVRAERSRPPGEPIRVTMLAQATPASRAYADRVGELLVINGEPAGDTASATYQRIDVPIAREGSLDAVLLGDRIRAFAPDIVLVSTGTDFAASIGPAIERDFPEPPYYVLNELALEVAPFGAWVSPNEARRRRIFGVAPAVGARNLENIAAFRTRYEATYTTEGPADECWSGADAFHALAYAVTGAIRLPSLRGADIARAFERLRVPGITIDVGETGVGLGPSVLLGESDIDLVGLWNDLDWKLPAGEIETDSAAWCLGRGPGDSLTLVRDAGVRWSRVAGSATGTLACP